MKSLQMLFERDLKRLEKEINLYTSDEQLWIVDGAISNSAGNLAIHICGNLQHFIGNIIGNSGYKRNREFEFSAKDLSREYIFNEISATKAEVAKALESFDTKLLHENYPLEVFGKPMTHEFFLFHLLGHLNYHLGQINYHRRLLT